MKRIIRDTGVPRGILEIWVPLAEHTRRMTNIAMNFPKAKQSWPSKKGAGRVLGGGGVIDGCSGTSRKYRENLKQNLEVGHTSDHQSHVLSCLSCHMR